MVNKIQEVSTHQRIAMHQTGKGTQIPSKSAQSKDSATHINAICWLVPEQLPYQNCKALKRLAGPLPTQGPFGDEHEEGGSPGTKPALEGLILFTVNDSCLHKLLLLLILSHSLS